MRRFILLRGHDDVAGFNPLFIGSKDATVERPSPRQSNPTVSIPFSSGQRMRLGTLAARWGTRLSFQSPFHRVKGCDACSERSSGPRVTVVSIPFSSGQRMRRGSWGEYAITYNTVSIPFSSGQRMRLAARWGVKLRDLLFQSPFHRVKGCDIPRAASTMLMRGFQSPFHRVKGCDGAVVTLCRPD